MVTASLVFSLSLRCFYGWYCCDSIWVSYRQAVRTGIRYHQHKVKVTLLTIHTYEHDNYNDQSMLQRSMDDESVDLVVQKRATTPFLSYSSSNFNLLQQSFLHSKLSSIPSTLHSSSSSLSASSSYSARSENNNDLYIPTIEQTTSNDNTNILTINTTIASSSNNMTTVDTIARAIPKHIGFIVDGNGRWAVENGYSRIDGHKQGANVTVEVVKTVFTAGVDYITLYLFSSENWKRPSMEIANIFELLDRYVNIFSTYLKENYIELVMIGDEDRVPYITKELIRGAGYKPSSNHDDSRGDSHTTSSSTNDKPYRRRVLTLALSYGGRQDIIQACKSILTTKISNNNNNNNNNYQTNNNNNNNKQVTISVEDIDEELFSKHLYLGKLSIPDPDLIIRTSGESRLSNFLLWESSYAEFISLSSYCECVGSDDNNKQANN